MRAVVICASRYGSTLEAGRWIAERMSFEGVDVDVKAPADVVSLEEYESVIMGSGLYAHKLLPELDALIDENIDILKTKKLALFGLSMKPEPVYVNGQVHGGLHHFVYVFEKLGKSLIHADMLPGEMVYSKLSDKDKAGLDQFYRMLKLSDRETEDRKQPRTLMNKADYWNFAETVLQKLGVVRR